MTDKPGLVEAVDELLATDWGLPAHVVAGLEAALAAHRSRVPVAWGCSECGFVEMVLDGRCDDEAEAQLTHTDQSQECRAAVRPLVEG